MIPGEIRTGSGMIELNAGRNQRSLDVTNTGDRPVQVGSHFHFFEVNRALAFDREQAFGYRLSIPAGTAVRFEPGETRLVVLVALGGTARVYGLNGLVNGWTGDDTLKKEALGHAARLGFVMKKWHDLPGED